MKRWRTPKARPGELKVSYGKEPHDIPDIFYCYGGEGATSSDSRMLSNFFEGTKGLFGRNLRQELEHRGYDITTMKFSIQHKKD